MADSQTPAVPSRCPSPAPTLIDETKEGPTVHEYSPARRYTLLVIFCLAQFLDTFNVTSLYSAIPAMAMSMGIAEGESTWIISAYQLTFASFLLISGRISDVYNPKFAFIGGVFVLAIFSLCSGFVSSKIPLFVLRALTGVAAAMAIPSAVTLLVGIFPEPTEQSRALGVFGGCGAVGIVLGLVIGAIFVQYASWPWVFWFVAIVCVPIVGLSVFLIAKQEPKEVRGGGAKWKSLDLFGVTTLTVALILFIFAVTSAATTGWGSSRVIASLIISMLMTAGFFYYETRIPADQAAIPPRTWFLPNFSVLFGTALFPFFWLPIGVSSFPVSLTGPLSHKINPKWLLLFGEALCIVSTILLAFADRPTRYWPYMFPGFILGSAGAMFVYTHTNIAIFRTTPASMAGTVGAIVNGALQLGSAVGISIVGSIESSIEERHAGYAGRAASFWFLLGIGALEFIAMLVFYRIRKENAK
ncbi:MFS general substrate transporter [Dichomitus squalens]|uniref:MFS general substrate transporter n=1 Tax=Dichomitus squalens TaxID=114155 RepID=A0A4Q9PM79_9APHY|nr:MFS general substrate transporter [Dichomitus squalens]TBU55246.1 MFS general substrate transporter [Dichomitus squalens]